MFIDVHSILNPSRPSATWSAWTPVDGSRHWGHLAPLSEMRRELDPALLVMSTFLTYPWLVQKKNIPRKPWFDYQTWPILVNRRAFHMFLFPIIFPNSQPCRRKEGTPSPRRRALRPALGQTSVPGSVGGSKFCKTGIDGISDDLFEKLVIFPWLKFIEGKWYWGVLRTLMTS